MTTPAICPDCHQTRTLTGLAHMCGGCFVSGCTAHNPEGMTTPAQPDPAEQLRAAAQLLRERGAEVPAEALAVARAILGGSGD